MIKLKIIQVYDRFARSIPKLKHTEGLTILNHTELQLLTDAHVFDDMTDKQIKIYTAAIEVFAEKGYLNASTKEIAAKADVAEGNIFSKFTNKRGLLNAIIEPVAKSIFPETLSSFTDSEPIPKDLSLHEFVDSLVKDRMDFLEDNQDVLKIFISEMVYDDQVRQQYLSKFPDAYWHTINDNLNLLKATHKMVNWDNWEIMQIMWSLIGGMVISFIFFHIQPTDKAVNHAVAALVKALNPRL